MDYKVAERMLMRNLKGSKIKQVNVIELAESIQTVKTKMRTSEMEKFFDVSHTTLSQINKINSLNPKAKKIIKQENLGIEQSFLITKIDDKNQEEVAKAIVDMNSHETRQFIKFLKKCKGSIQECKKQFDQQFRKKFNLLVIPMEDNIYRKLVEHAKKKKTQVHDLAYQIIEGYINDRK